MAHYCYLIWLASWANCFSMSYAHKSALVTWCSTLKRLVVLEGRQHSVGMADTSAISAYLRLVPVWSDGLCHHRHVLARAPVWDPRLPLFWILSKGSTTCLSCPAHVLQDNANIAIVL